MNKIAVFVALISIFVLTFVAVNTVFSDNQQIYKVLNMSFDMDTKIEVYPGETLTINGKLMNTGWLWLYNINLMTENLTYEHTINPDTIPVLPIKYYWVDGKAFRIPQNFTLMLKIPENETASEKDFFLVANGNFKVLLPSERSYLNYSKEVKQRIVLKFVPTPVITISDITFPDIVTQNKQFQISMIVINMGGIGTTANISISTPSDWTVDAREKTVSVEANSNSTVSFNIIPTNSSGQISLFLNYPVRQMIINITKTGPFLTPQVEAPEEKAVPSLISRIKALPPIVLLIIIILLVVIIWNIRAVIKFYKKRKKPEE